MKNWLIKLLRKWIRSLEGKRSETEEERNTHYSTRQYLKVFYMYDKQRSRDLGIRATFLCDQMGVAIGSVITAPGGITHSSVNTYPKFILDQAREQLKELVTA